LLEVKLDTGFLQVFLKYCEIPFLPGPAVKWQVKLKDLSAFDRTIRFFSFSQLLTASG
jgi:hypothetical protein